MTQPTDERSQFEDVGNEDRGMVPVDYPELFYGLVGAVGVELKAVSRILEENLRRVGYETELIKATSLLQGLSRFQSLEKSRFPVGEGIHRFMDAGNRLRELTDRKDIMAMLCIGEIRRKRRLRNKDTTQEAAAKKPLERVAHIIYSLKTPEEVELLKSVYGR